MAPYISLAFLYLYVLSFLPYLFILAKSAEELIPHSILRLLDILKFFSRPFRPKMVRRNLNISNDLEGLESKPIFTSMLNFKKRYIHEFL